MEQFASQLDKNQLQLTQAYQIKASSDIIVATHNLKINLQTISCFIVVNDGESLYLGTNVGSIIIVGIDLEKIEHFITISDSQNGCNTSNNNEDQDQYPSSFLEIDETLLIGTSIGQVYQLTMDKKHKVSLYMKLDQSQKVNQMKMHNQILIITQDHSITLVKNQTVLNQISINQIHGIISQSSFDENLRIIGLSTLKCINLVYNIRDSKLIVLQQGNEYQQQQQNYQWGSCIDYRQIKLILSQPNSTLSHYDCIQFQSLFNTTYKSKKIQNINFGHLHMIQDYSVLSINPCDSLVLINTQSNKLLTHEKLQSDEYSFKFYYYDEENEQISLLGQRQQDCRLTYASYEIMDLQTSLYFLVSKNKIKNAIKLVLQFKSLQNLKVLEPLLVVLFRKKQKQELLETQEYKIFNEIIKVLEELSKRQHEQKEIQISSSQDNQIDDDGFEKVVEVTQNNTSLSNNDDGFGILLEASSSQNIDLNINRQSAIILNSTIDSFSEVMLRQKSEKLNKEQILQQERLAKQLYRQNKKISRERKKKRFDHYIDNVFLQKLLILSYQANKPMLVKILVRKKMPREEKLKLLWVQNDFCSLVYRMEKLKYQSQDYARQMIFQKFRTYQTDLQVFYNGRLNTRYYLKSIVLPQLVEALKLARVSYKQKLKIILDAIDNYILSQYNYNKQLLNQ